MTTTSEHYSLQLAQQLIRNVSVTPEDAGCLQLICKELEPFGFVAEHLRFGEVDNLWLRRGTKSPLFCFVGHTDVVPTGPVDQWSVPPFEARVQDGELWGRGAADMKGGVAAMVAALRRFVESGEAPDDASMAMLLTSDEEGPAIDGTARVAEHLAETGQIPDWVLVGEPSAAQRPGDRIRIGRRGSQHCHMRILGLQGHVAYPDKVKNPIHAAAPFLTALAQEDWSLQEKDFPPTSLQLTQIHSGTGALNVVPGELQLHFNLRHSPYLTAEVIRRRIDELVQQHLAGTQTRMEWVTGAEPYLSQSGLLRRTTCEAIEAVAGLKPQISTGGGTSDGRFLAPLGSEVIEFGPCVETIHQIDERIPVADLKAVENCYLEILRRLFHT